MGGPYREKDKEGNRDREGYEWQESFVGRVHISEPKSLRTERLRRVGVIIMRIFSVALIVLGLSARVFSQTCQQKTLDFVVLSNDAVFAAVEDDIRKQLAVIGFDVRARFLEKEAFNQAMTDGDFHLCFSETWGPPYDPYSYASSWAARNEAHFAAMSQLQPPLTRDALFERIRRVHLENSTAVQARKWTEILNDVHQQAINLPLWGKRIPAVLNRRLGGFQNGQQQFEYLVNKILVLSGNKTVTIAPGAQTGLFTSVGRLDPHTYRPNEFFANNWVYEGLLTYGEGGVILPALAVTWHLQSLATGGQRITFGLRPGVRFHDGSLWNCSVAKLNFDHVLAPPLTTDDYHGWYSLPKEISRWFCNDQGQFVVETKENYYPLLQELTYIRPLRMLSPLGFVNGLGTSPLTDNSCHQGWGTITGNGATITCKGISRISGTGPFKFDSRSPHPEGGDAEVVFAAHSEYWGGAPDIEKLKIVRYDDHEQVKEALLSGELDMVIGAGVLTYSDIIEFRNMFSEDFLVTHSAPLQNVLVIMNSGKSPTNDIVVRKAIMHAVNKAEIVEKEFGGLERPVSSLFPENAPFSDIDLLPRWDYDIEKARFLNCAALDDDSGLSGGAIAGIVIAVLVALAAVTWGFFAVFRYGYSKGYNQVNAHAQEDIELQNNREAEALKKPGQD